MAMGAGPISLNFCDIVLLQLAAMGKESLQLYGFIYPADWK